MKKCVFVLFLLVTINGFSQHNPPGQPHRSLSATTSGTINTDCMGQGCFYDGPTILINEVMLSPSTGDGSIYDSDNTRRGEWIELYNPHKCESADISCYFLGNNAPEGSNYGGGFSIPPGTVVPPQGFALVRGMNAPAVPANLLVQNGGNVVEIIVNGRLCMEGNTRLWFPNAGGWFAFYDANGVPQDAISWASQSNSCMSCSPCTPINSDCGYSGVLAAYNSIPAARKNIISSSVPTSNRTFSRIPDGGAWSYNSPTIATYADCNSNCVDPPVITCNGTATVTVTGGVPPYSYQWNDAMFQTTPTALGLCEGTYSVTVTDAMMDTVTATYTVTNFVPTVSHPSSIYCMSDSFAVVQGGTPLGGIYECEYLEDSVIFFDDNIAHYDLTYTYTDTNGCSASAPFTITVNPVYHTVIYDTICQYDGYYLYGFTISSQETEIPGDFTEIQLAQTINHCDSIITLHLTVHPSETFVFDDSICHNQAFSNYGFNFPADSLPLGNQQFTRIFQNQFQCDSTVILNLTVLPVYDLYEEVSICKNMTYQQNGFNISADTLEVGTYEWRHQTVTAVGCDSSFTLTLHIFPTHLETYTDTICQGETYDLHGFHLTSNETGFTGDFVHTQNLSNIYGCDSIIILNLLITSSPDVDFLPSPERLILSEGGLVDFINLTDISQITAGEIYSWLWDFGDGNSETTDNYNLQHTYESWGDYLVTLTLTSSFGCSKQMSHYVYVEADLEFPNIITPNGDNFNDVFAVINLNPSTPNVFSVYDRWGKKVYEKENYQTYIKDDILYNAEQGFNAENLSDGVYYYVFHYEGYTKTIEYHSSLTILRDVK